MFTLYYVRYRNILPLVVAHSAIDVFLVSGYDQKVFVTLRGLMGI